MFKINSKGMFTKFPGITVISDTNPKDTHFWQGIYDVLNQNPLVRQHYALLPAASYHMTAYSLYNQGSMSENEWNAFVTDNLMFFDVLNAHLPKFLAISPRISITPQLVTDGVLQLIVEIPRQQRKKLEEFAAFFGLEEKMPNSFHITLAYQYKELAPQEKKTIAENLLRHINATLPTDRFLTLQTPSLRHFNDMTCFTPWDGKQNPFAKVGTPTSQARFFTASASSVSSACGRMSPKGTTPSFGPT